MAVKSKTFKRLAPIFYALLIVIMMILSADILQFGVAYAADVDNQFDETSVLDDLFYDGSQYTIGDFPIDKNGKIDVINVLEYGFPYNEGQNAVYGLYIYVYNPAQLALSRYIGNTKVQIATHYNAAGQPVNYGKYQLRVVSATDDGLLLKYKVVDNKYEIYNRAAAENKQSGVRRYDISGVEFAVLNEKDSYKYYF